MIGTIRNYRVYRKSNLRNAWRISGMNFLVKSLTRWIGFAVVVAGVLYLISDAANASASTATAKAAQQRQVEYIAALEGIVKACLSDATGKPVSIGGRIHLCGIVDIGEIK